MKGVQLRFYMYEDQHAHGKLLYEWLLERAMRLGIPGGSAFRAVAGYGRDGRLHEQTFFELAGNTPMLVEFIVAENESDRLLAVLEAEGLALFYARLPVEFGLTGSKA